MYHKVASLVLLALACLTIEHRVRVGQTYRTSEQALHLCIGTYDHPARLQNNNQREVRHCIHQSVLSQMCRHPVNSLQTTRENSKIPCQKSLSIPHNEHFTMEIGIMMQEQLLVPWFGASCLQPSLQLFSHKN